MASHFNHAKKIIKECFLILGVIDIAGINRHLVGPLEQSDGVLANFFTSSFLEKLEESFSVILE